MLAFLLLFSSLAHAQVSDTELEPFLAAAQGENLYELLGRPVRDQDILMIIGQLGLGALENSYSNLGTQGVGLCLSFSSERISRVYLRSNYGSDADCPPGSFRGDLPFGLRWGDDRERVNELLGSPRVDKTWGDWWRDGAEGFIHVEYQYGLSSLTIGNEGWVPPDVSKWFERHRKSEVGLLDSAYSAARQDRPPDPDPAEESYVAEPETPQAAPQPAPNPMPQQVRAPEPQPYVPPQINAPPETVAASRPAALPSLSEPARTGAKAKAESAVVIGLESYPFLGSGVPHARSDADTFADFLVYTRGVPMQNVLTLKSGAREQILAQIERAAREAGAGGLVWVYFAGHGAANPKNGERMLLGDDVRADVLAFGSRGVSVTEIERMVSAAGARPVLVLDTCYAGVGRSGDSFLGGTRFIVPTYTTAPAAGAAQWNASSPDEISGPLPGVDHCAFTYFAVGALRGWADGELDGKRDGKVTAAEAQAYVVRALRRKGTNTQRPVWVGPDDLVLSSGIEVGPGL